MKCAFFGLAVAFLSHAGQAQPAPPGPLNPDLWQARGQADLVLLDKVKAQPEAASLKVGQTRVFGSLTITLRRCVSHPADQAQDSAALIDITDSHSAAFGYHAWMLANEPGLSQLEHPIYDVHLTACR